MLAFEGFLFVSDPIKSEILFVGGQGGFGGRRVLEPRVYRRKRSFKVASVASEPWNSGLHVGNGSLES